MTPQDGKIAMTRLTAMLIQEDPEVYASSFGPIDGKYGLYVGTLDEKRPRTLLTSEPVYSTPQEASQAAENVIQRIRDLSI